MRREGRIELGRQRRSRPGWILAGCFLLPLLALCSATVASRADWASVQRPFAQWRWASEPSGAGLTGVAVRDDGWLVVAEPLKLSNNTGDGYLHLLPPWQSRVSPGNRFGPQIDPYRVVIRKGRLYVLGNTPLSYQGSDCPIYEVRADTGALLRRMPVPAFCGSDLAVSPLAPNAIYLENATPPFGAPSAQEIDALDPDSGSVTPFIQPGPGGAPNFAYTALAFARGGFPFFVFAPAPAQPVQPKTFGVYAYDSSGRELYQILPPNTSPFPDQLGGGIALTANCQGSPELFYLSGAEPPPAVPPAETDVYGVVNPSAISITSNQVARSPITNASPEDGAMTLDRSGRLVVAEASYIMLLTCPGFHEPTPAPATQSPLPSATALPPPTPTPAATPQPVIPTHADQPPLGPPPVLGSGGTPAGPGLSTAAQPQSAAVPNPAALADAPDQQPVMGLTATALEPALLLYAVAAGLGALTTVICLQGGPSRRPRLAIRQGERDDALRRGRPRAAQGSGAPP